MTIVVILVSQMYYAYGVLVGRGLGLSTMQTAITDFMLRGI